MTLHSIEGVIMSRTKISIVVSTIVMSLPSFAFAGKPTGLMPLSAKELKAMQKKLGMKKVKNILPNEIGLKRANEARIRLGLSPLPTNMARRFGNETETDTDLENDFEFGGTTSNVATDGFGGVLPTSVDNSQLPSFPSIGQQAWNSCVGWAMGYYQFSHNTGLAMGWNNKTDLSKKCSPKFLYNMINSGSDSGAYFSDGFSIMQKHGCITNANFPENNNYRDWNANPQHWQDAISFRTKAVQYVYNVDTETGLEQAKQMLNNGYLLTYGTFINSWQMTTIKANPDSVSNPLSGQQVLKYVNGTEGSHAMTIVGYDDNAWTDINTNNVVDAGELGVFKIANSWGTSWGNSGFALIAYDALKTVSAVAGGPTTGRQPAIQSRLVYHMPVRASGGVAYSPKYLARFTVKHSVRSQMSLKFGWSSPTSLIATTSYIPFALINKGGPYAFNGTTTAVDGTFVMDVTDLPISSVSDNKVYFTLSDNAAGSAGNVSNFQLIDVTKGTQVAANLVTALTADASSVTTSLNYGSNVLNTAPVAALAVSTVSGTTPLVVDFDGGFSFDQDGTIAFYSWNFGDGSTATGAYVSKTYNTAGAYTASLTVTDNDGATSTKSISIAATAPIVSTIDTTLPTVSLTDPLNGSKYPRNAIVYSKATATDNKGVYKVKFYVNGKLKCTDYSSPYNCNLYMPFGTSISVRARAYDAAGNYQTSNTSYISN